MSETTAPLHTKTAKAAPAPNIKRLVDLVDRGPEDDVLYPSTSNNTIFHKDARPYHNVVSEIVEIGYQGNAAWGQRFTIPLKHDETGDLIQWVAIRLKPFSWLGPELEAKLQNGLWDYADTTGATWTWASSLGSIAIAKVEFEIGDTLVETWTGEWMDIWSRTWLDAGRSGTWDSDIYGQRPFREIRVPSNGVRNKPPFTTFNATEDGYVYCWIPLAFFKRPQLAFPIVAMEDGRQEIRLHVTLRPFADVVRRQNIPRTNPCEVPLGSSIILLDKTGQTPVQWSYTLPTTVPGFEDVTVLVGVVHTEDPLRSDYMNVPMELLYEPVKYMRFALPPGQTQASTTPITVHFPLTEFNGPLREICFFLRRTGVWQFNEWTNYGSLLENDFFPTFSTVLGVVPTQQPILVSAELQVGNATWCSETEKWWRVEYAMDHRGGVRLFGGMVYGYSFGDVAGWDVEDLQPAGTVNASRTTLRLDLTMLAPAPVSGNTYIPGWDVHVFGCSYDWMRFVKGMAVPLFRD